MNLPIDNKLVLTDTPPGGARIVAMVELKGRIFLATEDHVYELVDGLFRKMVFVLQEGSQ